MRTFEYVVVDAVAEHLNQLGLDGWELVSVTATSAENPLLGTTTYRYRAYLKRCIQDRDYMRDMAAQQAPANPFR